MIAGWIALGCLVLTMFFSAAEMAFLAADRIRLESRAAGGDRAARAYLDAFRTPARVIATAMLGVTVSHVVAGVTVTGALLPALGGLAPLAATAILAPVMLVLGEILPKAVARSYATALAPRVLTPLRWAGHALAPLVALGEGLVRLVLGRAGAEVERRLGVSREELKALLQHEPDEAEVSRREAAIINRIFRLGERTAQDVMAPLTEAAMLPETATPQEAAQLVARTGFSRLPIWRDRETHIVGVLTAMDLLRRGATARTVGELARPATYVPERLPLDRLLRQMQERRLRIAAVVDEFGGAVGFVTLEDVLEEIVGEIRDERHQAGPTVERLPDGAFRIPGRASIEEVNAVLDRPLPAGEYETVAGLVLAALGRIPRTGEACDVAGYTITVLDADARRVVAVKLAPARGGVARP